MAGDETRKRCETGLRRTAMILSLLPTILPSIFSSLASQITQVPRLKQRTRRRVAGTPEYFSFFLLHYSLFSAADKDTSTQRPQKEEKRKDHAKRIPDERRGWISLSSYSCVCVCVYLRMYIIYSTYSRVLAPLEFKRIYLTQG